MQLSTRIRLFCSFVIPTIAAITCFMSRYTVPSPPPALALTTLVIVLVWIAVGESTWRFSLTVPDKQAELYESTLLCAGLLSLAVLPVLFWLWRTLLDTPLGEEAAVCVSLVLTHSKALGVFYLITKWRAANDAST